MKEHVRLSQNLLVCFSFPNPAKVEPCHLCASLFQNSQEEQMVFQRVWMKSPPTGADITSPVAQLYCGIVTPTVSVHQLTLLPTTNWKM